MQVRAAGIACFAHLTNHLSALDPLTAPDIHFTQMGINGVERLATKTEIVLDRDRHAIGIAFVLHSAVKTVASPHNLAWPGGQDRSIAGGGNIDAGMQIFQTKERASIAVLWVWPVDLIGGDRAA